jgi:excisionase family DNA binding protein
MANNDFGAMMTTSDVAHMLNVHINTVRRWSNQGILKTYRIGSRGDRRFNRKDIEEFLHNKVGIEPNMTTENGEMSIFFTNNVDR